MAREHELLADGHPSIYEPGERKLRICFCLPEKGTDEETGILLLLAGFGGHTDASVYKKMRQQFADRYNLITIQCDYFGWEFMQESQDLLFNIDRHFLAQRFSAYEIADIYSNGDADIHKLLKHAGNHSIHLTCKANINENLTNFNDMGVMQAVDNIKSVLAIKDYLSNNLLNLNYNKVIVYGHSHGAYLSYLCNAFAPGLFTLLIDNSAWLLPAYLEKDRLLHYQNGDALLTVQFQYLAKETCPDKQILTLPSLYKQFKNNCNIISFHGVTDELVNHLEKRNFINSIPKANYYEVSEYRLDGRIFNSTNHGLGADFLELFAYVMDELYNEQWINPSSDKFSLPDNTSYRTERFQYTFNYHKGVHVKRASE